MKIIWTLGFQNIRLIIREKTTVIWMVIVPCLYIAVFGSAFRGMNSQNQIKTQLSVRNLDDGFMSQRLLDSFKSENIEIKGLDQEPESPPVRLLRIPAGLTERLLAGKKDTLVYEKRTDTDVNAAMAAELGIRKAMVRTLADMAELKINHKKVRPEAFADLDARDPLIRMKTEMAGRHITIPEGFNAQVPAQVIQFSLLIVFVFAGNMLFEEKQTGLLRRMRIAPVSFLQLYLGKLLGVLLVGISQIVLLLLVGRFAFGVYLGHSLLALSLLAVCYAAAIGAMGLILGFLIKNGEKLTGIAIVLSLAMAALSGCWWPAEIMPGWMQKFAIFLPPGLALKAFHRLFSFGDGFLNVLPYILGEAGFALLFSSIFAIVFVKFVKTEHMV